MVFVVDDLLIIAISTAIAAGAAGVAGAGMLSKGTDSSFNKTNYRGDKYKTDGALKGVDPVGTVGHNPEGFPVDAQGVRIESDGTIFDRMNIGSYDIVALSSAVANATDFIVGGAGNSIFELTYPKGSGSRRIKTLQKKLKTDPTWIKEIAESVFGSGAIKGLTGKQIVETLGNKPQAISGIIGADEAARKELLDKLKGYDPTWNIPRIVPSKIENYRPPSAGDDFVPAVNIPTTGGAKLPGGLPTLPGIPDVPPGKSGGPSGFPGGLIPTTGGVDVPPGSRTLPTDKTAIDGGKIKPIPIPVPTTDSIPKVDPKDGPKKRDPEKDKPKPFPKPVPEPKDTDSEVVEKLISKPAGPKKPVQWYPSYNMGGQDILKLTDTEKLEEMKNWSLFDLVSPLLEGDQDNLLSLQNKMRQNLRFQNNYPNPTEPPSPVPLPNTSDWAYPMQSGYPTSYPMRYDGPQANGMYYDHWGNDRNLYLNQRINMASGVDNPDLQQVLNSQSRGFTGIDSQIGKTNSKFSLLEGIDSSSVSALDIQLCRM